MLVVGDGNFSHAVGLVRRALGLGTEEDGPLYSWKHHWDELQTFSQIVVSSLYPSEEPFVKAYGDIGRQSLAALRELPIRATAIRAATTSALATNFPENVTEIVVSFLPSVSVTIAWSVDATKFGRVLWQPPVDPHPRFDAVGTKHPNTRRLSLSSLIARSVSAVWNYPQAVVQTPYSHVAAAGGLLENDGRLRENGRDRYFEANEDLLRMFLCNVKQVLTPWAQLRLVVHNRQITSFNIVRYVRAKTPMASLSKLSVGIWESVCADERCAGDRKLFVSRPVRSVQSSGDEGVFAKSPR
jgi:hypothetical protein